MLEDVTKSWWGVPAIPRWLCPRCLVESDTELWRECELECEVCGTHFGRVCPHCEESFDVVWDADELARAQKAMNP